MDFIERFFGASPDGGNGSVEMLLLLLPMALGVLMALARSRRHGPT
jgi:hypothetical protein